MKLQLFVRADNLPSPKSWYRKRSPNAFAVISNVTEVGSVMGIKRRRLGLTEVVSASSPEWTSVLVLDHNPQSEHHVAIDVFHTDQATQKFATRGQHDLRYQGVEHRGVPIPGDSNLLTGVLFSIDKILKTPDWTLSEKIPGSSNGKVTVHLEPSKQGNQDSTFFQFQLEGTGFLKGKRNTQVFYEIRRKHYGQTDDDWRPVYRSNHEKDLINPSWNEDEIDVEFLCNHDLNRQLMIRVMSADGPGQQNVMGSFETDVHGLIGAVISFRDSLDNSKAFALMNDGGQKVGEILVRKASVQSTTDAASEPVLIEPNSPIHILPPTEVVEILPPPNLPRGTITAGFKDYARNCPIDLCFAVDFTDANGDLQSPGSAHYRTGGQRNSYEWTMGIVGETFATLNPSHEYPVWGFGGCFDNKAYPIFQCGSSPKANGVQGLIDAYASTFQTGVTFGKQRKYDQILMAAAHHAKKQLDEAQRRRSLSYTVLTVLTAGTDVLSAKEKLVSIADAPLSVLFIRIPGCRGESTPLDEQKLEVFLSNRNCRQLCTVLDGVPMVSRRDGDQVSRKILEAIEEQMPSYFQKEGISP